MDLSRLKIDRAPPARRRRSGGGWGGRLLLLGAIAGAAWFLRDPIQRRLDRFMLPEVSVAPVTRTKQVTQGAVSGIAANGHIVARVRAALSADTPGRIVELNVEEGQSVEAGFVVARLFAEELEADRDRAAAELHVARVAVERSAAEIGAVTADLARLREASESAVADHDEARARERLAVLDLRRAEALLADEIGTQDRVDQARAALETAQARVRSTDALAKTAVAAVGQAEAREALARATRAEVEAGVATAEAELARAEATLDKTIIRAPFDGVIVLKDAEVGEVVSPNSQAGSNARGSVATMVDFRSLEVQAEVPEVSLSAVEIDRPATVFLDAYPETGIDGRVSRIWPTANRQKATVEVRVTLDEIDPRMRPEMGVRVVFPADEPDDATSGDDTIDAFSILVPERAVVRADGGSHVFLLEQDRARRREITVGGRTPTKVAVNEGLEEGELLVIDPPPALRDGDRVRRRE